MRRTLCTWAVLALGLLILVPDEADARRRRSRKNNNYYSSNYVRPTSTTTVANNTPEKAEKKAPRWTVGKLWKHTRGDRTEYDYNWAARRDWKKPEAKPWLFADRVRIKLDLRDDLRPLADQLKVKLTWNYMHRSKTLHTTWAEIQQDGEDRYLDLTGLDEGRLVKARLEIFRPQATEATAAQITPATFAASKQGDDTPAGYERVGAVHAPYYGVTGSEANEEWQRRAQIVSFSFSQWYHDEAYGGRYCNYDCYSFYQKSANSELAGFTKKSVANSDVPKLSKAGRRFHGDYLIMSGHYGMGLCYDEDTDRFCSIEGNYALSGPYRINIDQNYHGLYTWHTIMNIVPRAKSAPAKVETAAHEG